MVSEWTFTNIATGIVVTAVTHIIGFSCLVRCLKMKKKLMPYVSGLGFLSALFYLGSIACLAFVIFAIAGILEATTPILALVSRVLILIPYAFMYRGSSVD